MFPWLLALVLMGSALAEEPSLELSVRGTGPYVGHPSQVAIRASAPMAHGGAGVVRITGPHRYEVEIPVGLSPPPPRRLPACDPLPEDPHSCDHQPAFAPQGGFRGTSVATPPWPQAGIYEVVYRDRKQTLGPVRVEVVDHPLARYAVLPRGYAETVRATDRFKRTVGHDPVYSPALIVCGEKRGAELCIHATEPLGARCPGVLAALGPEGVWVGEGTQAYKVHEGLPTTWSWCSEGRLIELRPRFVPGRERDRLLRRLFAVAPSDGRS